MTDPVEILGDLTNMLPAKGDSFLFIPPSQLPTPPSLIVMNGFCFVVGLAMCAATTGMVVYCVFGNEVFDDDDTREEELKNDAPEETNTPCDIDGNNNLLYEYHNAFHFVSALAICGATAGVVFYSAFDNHACNHSGACDEDFGDASYNIGEVKAPEKRDGNAFHEYNSALNVLGKNGCLEQDYHFTSPSPTSESMPNYNSSAITLKALLILAILAKSDADDDDSDDDVQEEFEEENQDKDEEFSDNHGTTHHQTAATEDTTALEKLTEEERDTVESHGTDDMQSTAVHDDTTAMGGVLADEDIAADKFVTQGTAINPAAVLGAAAPPTELDDPSTANVADDIKTEEAAAPLIDAVLEVVEDLDENEYDDEVMKVAVTPEDNPKQPKRDWWSEDLDSDELDFDDYPFWASTSTLADTEPIIGAITNGSDSEWQIVTRGTKNPTPVPASTRAESSIPDWRVVVKAREERDREELAKWEQFQKEKVEAQEKARAERERAKAQSQKNQKEMREKRENLTERMAEMARKIKSLLDGGGRTKSEMDVQSAKRKEAAADVQLKTDKTTSSIDKVLAKLKAQREALMEQARKESAPLPTPVPPITRVVPEKVEQGSGNEKEKKIPSPVVSSREPSPVESPASAPASSESPASEIVPERGSTGNEKENQTYISPCAAPFESLPSAPASSTASEVVVLPKIEKASDETEREEEFPPLGPVVSLTSAPKAARTWAQVASGSNANTTSSSSVIAVVPRVSPSSTVVSAIETTDRRLVRVLRMPFGPSMDRVPFARRRRNTNMDAVVEQVRAGPSTSEWGGMRGWRD
ncbi:hypothetical protein C0991_004116 [Blastosporella zonata]|nr:hypothetical protein C0991_004116 [Blastosporella zonata]